MAQAGDGRAALRVAPVSTRESGADLREEGAGARCGGGVREGIEQTAGLYSRGGGTAALAGQGELTGEGRASTTPGDCGRVSRRGAAPPRPRARDPGGALGPAQRPGALVRRRVRGASESHVHRVPPAAA